MGQRGFIRDFQSCPLNLKSKRTVRFRTGKAESGQQARHFWVTATRKPLGSNDEAIGTRLATVSDSAPGVGNTLNRGLERQITDGGLLWEHFR